MEPRSSQAMGLTVAAVGRGRRPASAVSRRVRPPLPLCRRAQARHCRRPAQLAAVFVEGHHDGELHL